MDLCSFQWTEEAAEAFEQLKQRLTTTPILGYPRLGGDYVLNTDASDHGIGAVLSQVQEGGEQPVTYYSHMLSCSEKQYCTTRKDLAIVNIPILTVMVSTSLCKQTMLP